jgi:hypothetical protein
MARFVVAGGNTTIIFEYMAVTQKIQNILVPAARYFYDKESTVNAQPIPFDGLTNQQKLDYIDMFVKRLINEAAREQKIADAKAAAAADADQNLSV